MDEAHHGNRDASGHYRPAEPLAYPPVFTTAADLLGFLRWLRGYLFGWNLVYALIAAAFWLWLTPALSSFESIDALSVSAVLGRNALLVLLFFGAWHVRLYLHRTQATRFKYNPEWPKEVSSAFLFGNQTRDNLFWTFASAVPIWTAYEVLTLWAMANGVIPTLSLREHPIAAAAILLTIPLFREVHFYVTHRLIHTDLAYRHIHSLHHKNRNPGPWSGLAMHPVEHLIYFSGVLVHWVVVSHPVHVIYHLIHLGLVPASGHCGFDKVEAGGTRAMETHCYSHYLHHKHFECNYTDGAIPLDRWFGTFHDGSDESYRRLRRRLKEKRQRARPVKA